MATPSHVPFPSFGHLRPATWNDDSYDNSEFVDAHPDVFAPQWSTQPDASSTPTHAHVERAYTPPPPSTATEIPRANIHSLPPPIGRTSKVHWTISKGIDTVIPAAEEDGIALRIRGNQCVHL